MPLRRPEVRDLERDCRRSASPPVRAPRSSEARRIRTARPPSAERNPSLLAPVGAPAQLRVVVADLYRPGERLRRTRSPISVKNVGSVRGGVGRVGAGRRSPCPASRIWATDSSIASRESLLSENRRARFGAPPATSFPSGRDRRATKLSAHFAESARARRALGLGRVVPRHWEARSTSSWKLPPVALAAGLKRREARSDDAAVKDRGEVESLVLARTRRPGRASCR